MNARQQYELLGTIDDVVRETLADADAARLVALLKDDAEACMLYTRLVRLDVDLEWLCSTRPKQEVFTAGPAVLQVLSPPIANNSSEAHAKPEPAKTPTLATALWSRKSSFFSPSLLGCVALVGLLVYGSFVLVAWNLRPESGNGPQAGLGSQRQPPASNGGVATLTETRNCVWQPDAGQTAWQAGATLRMNDGLDLASGLITVTFDDGAVVTLEGPLHFVVQATGRGFVQHGKLVARVPPKAIGFTVVTPTAKVIDLGTEFGLAVDTSGTTNARVFRGAVEIESLPTPGRTGTTPRRRLAAGQAVSIRADATGKIRTIDGTELHFVRELPAITPDSNARPAAYGSQVIAETKPVAYWDFEKLYRNGVLDLVGKFSPDEFAPFDAGVHGPRAAEGFNGMATSNRAIRVKDGSRVALTGMATMLRITAQSYSVQVWFNSAVSFDSRQVQYLFGRGNGDRVNSDVRDSVGVWGHHFAQNMRSGYLAFFSGDPKWTLVSGKTKVEPNSWHHLLFVRDGTQVRVYLNGKLDIETECPWNGGAGEHLSLGNRADWLSHTWLDGHLDEVAIWNRALNEEEAAAVYALAKAMSANTNQTNNHRP